MDLLQGMLEGAGHRVGRVDWRSDAMARVDVGIFLELWSRRLAAHARKTVGIFNLEWFQRSWIPALDTVTQLWAKSGEAHKVYQQLGRGNPHFTGFLGRDLYDPSVERTLSCLHVRGHSDLKNTHQVINAWYRNPDLPPLTIVSAVPLQVPTGVRLLGRLTEEELRYEMNRAAIHLCPSQAEGWGHYIVEALGVGAHVVTLYGSPMNEHVLPAWGTLVQPTRVGKRGMVAEYGVSARVLAEAIRKAAAIPDADRARMSRHARIQFEVRNETFTKMALRLLEEI